MRCTVPSRRYRTDGVLNMSDAIVTSRVIAHCQLPALQSASAALRAVKITNGSWLCAMVRSVLNVAGQRACIFRSVGGLRAIALRVHYAQRGNHTLTATTLQSKNRGIKVTLELDSSCAVQWLLCIGRDFDRVEGWCNLNSLDGHCCETTRIG